MAEEKGSGDASIIINILVLDSKGKGNGMCGKGYTISFHHTRFFQLNMANPQISFHWKTEIPNYNKKKFTSV